MLNFDFKSYTSGCYNTIDLNILKDKKDRIISKFKSSDMIGWTKEVDYSLIDDIRKTAEDIKKISTCLVVIGIGGSFMTSKAINEIFKSSFNDTSFKVIYLGYSLNTKNLSEVLDYLKTVDFSLNVISKSGTTLETTITYDLIKDLMKSKYSAEEIKKRIIITTDKTKGSLRQEANDIGYKTYEIDDDIGGRYSAITPAHLLPLALNFNIENFAKGYSNGKNYMGEAYLYAVNRKILFDNRKYIENFCFYDEKLLLFGEWLKQLFGETEGKDKKGIFPITTLYTRDLHSLGQFIQEGNPIIFETVIKINEEKDLIYKGKSLKDVNNIITTSVIKAHFSGGVPTNIIYIDKINEETLGEMLYFFMLAAAFSGYLFGVDPFNQPGVEVYKKEIKDNLKI